MAPVLTPAVTWVPRPKRSYPNSDSNPRPKRPDKPYSDFPLFAHANGRWAKKIRGRFVYFGPWSDSDDALQWYLEQRDDLHADRPLPIDDEEKLFGPARPIILNGIEDLMIKADRVVDLLLNPIEDEHRRDEFLDHPALNLPMSLRRAAFTCHVHG